MIDITPITYQGTPTEIMTILLQQSEDSQYKHKSEQYAINQLENLFMMFEKEFEHMTNMEQLQYIDFINQTFNELRKQKPTLNNQDEVIRFQLDLFRWSSYWRGVISWKKTKKYPDFGLDMEHMHLFAMTYLKSRDRVLYLKREYERTIKNYKFGDKVLEDVKSKLKDMISDYELIAGDEELSKKSKSTEQSSSMEGAELTVDDTEDNTSRKEQTPIVADKIKPYLTSTEAMQLLCVKKTKLYQLTKDGILNPKKLGARKNLYKTSELLKYIEQKGKSDINKQRNT